MYKRRNTKRKDVSNFWFMVDYVQVVVEKWGLLRAKISLYAWKTGKNFYGWLKAWTIPKRKWLQTRIDHCTWLPWKQIIISKERCHHFPGGSADAWLIKICGAGHPDIESTYRGLFEMARYLSTKFRKSKPGRVVAKVPELFSCRLSHRVSLRSFYFEIWIDIELLRGSLWEHLRYQLSGLDYCYKILDSKCLGEDRRKKTLAVTI